MISQLSLEDIMSLHPKYSIAKYRTIYQWQMDYCENDMQLAVFLSWLISKYFFLKDSNKELVDRNRKLGIPTDDESIVFSYKTVIKETLHSVKSKKKISSILKDFKGRGILIEIPKNRGESSVYKFNPKPLVDFVLNLHPDLSIFESKKQSYDQQQPKQYSQNVSYIEPKQATKPTQKTQAQQPKQYSQNVSYIESKQATKQPTPQAHKIDLSSADLPHEQRTWLSFTEFCKNRMTPETFRSVEKSTARENSKQIEVTIPVECNGLLTKYVESYFNKKEIKFTREAS